MKARHSRTALCVILAASLVAACVTAQTSPKNQTPHETPDDTNFAAIQPGNQNVDQDTSVPAQGSTDQALKFLKKATVISNGDVEAVGALAHSYLVLHQPVDALVQYEIALGAKPTEVRWLTGRGIALDQLGRHEEARQSYFGALAMAPEGTPAYANATINLALSFALSGDNAKATELLKRLTRNDRFAAAAYQNLGLVDATTRSPIETTALLQNQIARTQAQDRIAQPSQTQTQEIASR